MAGNEQNGMSRRRLLTGAGLAGAGLAAASAGVLPGLGPAARAAERHRCDRAAACRGLRQQHAVRPDLPACRRSRR